MGFLATHPTRETAPARRSASASSEGDERELVAQARAGSVSAFELLVEKYERRAFRLAQNITRNREDAEDATQNALVQAFRNLSTFQGASSFYTWLARITINEALMGKRRRRVGVVSIDESDEGYLLHSVGIENRAFSPEQRCSQTELQDILAKTIRALGPGYRIVFQLRDVENLSTRETARVLSLSAAAVKSRLRRARSRVRRSLNKYLAVGRSQPRGGGFD